MTMMIMIATKFFDLPRGQKNWVVKKKKKQEMGNLLGTLFMVFSAIFIF